MTKVCCYIRKSTKDKQKYSLESQTNQLTRFCKENDLEIVEWFQDVESGTRKDRPGLKKALEMCEKNKFALVVLRTDRLSRVPSQMFGLLENPKLQIYVAELGMVCDPIMIGQFILYSKFELDILKRRVKEGMATALRKHRISNPNYKFGNPQIEIAQANSRKVRSEHADKIAMEYNNLVSSLYFQTGSYSGTARELNKLGIQSQRGKKWYPSTVSTILSRYNNLMENNEK